MWLYDFKKWFENAPENEKTFRPNGKKEDFKYADEGIDYLKKNNQLVEENINEIIYDRLFKRGYSLEDIDEYRKTRNFI